MCLDPNDRELARPKLKKESDNLIEIKQDIRIKDEMTKEKDTYAELLKLDDLRKRGILNEAEFESQKKQLLNSK